MITDEGPPDRAAMLAAVPLLSKLDWDQIGVLAEVGEYQVFQEGEVIVGQGEKGLGLYLIVDGLADVRRSGRLVATLSAGKFFGESALIVEAPRTADVVAATDVRCFVVTRWDFWSAIGVDPETNRRLFVETVRRLRSFTAELVE
ncbi:MAG: cyclic nucleotide-binding domain-containing protein [Thermoplasmata archaeon]